MKLIVLREIGGIWENLRANQAKETAGRTLQRREELVDNVELA